jgi:hypothetical protein
MKWCGWEKMGRREYGSLRNRIGNREFGMRDWSWEPGIESWKDGNQVFRKI